MPAKKRQRPSVPEVVIPTKPKKKYVALNTIDYVSIHHGRYAHVEPGDVFDDMNSIGIRNELEHGNIQEYVEGGEK